MGLEVQNHNKAFLHRGELSHTEQKYEIRFIPMSEVLRQIRRFSAHHFSGKSDHLQRYQLHNFSHFFAEICQTAKRSLYDTSRITYVPVVPQQISLKGNMYWFSIYGERHIFLASHRCPRYHLHRSLFFYTRHHKPSLENTLSFLVKC